MKIERQSSLPLQPSDKDASKYSHHERRTENHKAGKGGEYSIIKKMERCWREKAEFRTQNCHPHCRQQRIALTLGAS